jgi:hypothetical protein
MKVILRTKQHTVYEKKSGRFAVKDAEKNWVNGDDKVAVLLAEGLVKTAPPAVAEAPVKEAPVEEAPAEETAVEEAPAEEAPVEQAPVEQAPVEVTAVDETAAEKATEKDSAS